MVNDINNLSHTTWNCKYHIVFAPKYRRQIFYKEKKSEIGKILRQLCEWKKIEILEAEVCPDHIHMLVRIPPSISVSGFMGYLKGKSSLMIFEKWGNLKYRYGNRNFWCRGYYVDTVGKNTKKIKEYIENQLKTDRIENPLPFYDGLDGVLGKSKRARERVVKATFVGAGKEGLCPQMQNPRLRRGIFIPKRVFYWGILSAPQVPPYPAPGGLRAKCSMLLSVF